MDGRGAASRDGLAQGAPARGCPDPRLVLRQETARAGGAGGARARPPRRRRRPQLARPGAEAHHCRPPRGRGGLSGHAERRGLARPGRGRIRAGPRRRTARVVVTGGRRLGAARAPAPRGLLPLASGRGTRRSRRVPHRGGRAAPGGARRRGADRSQAPAPRARPARPAGAARSPRPRRPRPLRGSRTRRRSSA